MENPTTNKEPAPAPTAVEANREQEIRCRAYEIYEARGRENGHDREDWLRAEAELTGRTEIAIAA